MTKIKQLLLAFLFVQISLSVFCQCNPTFSTVINYSAVGAQWDIVTADFNGDGNLDLASANPTANCVSVLLGSAAGVFTTVTNFTTNILNPFQIKSTDLDSDGNLDLVITNTDRYYPLTSPFNDQLTVLMGTGSGNFAAAINYTVAPKSYGIILEDFNSDNKPDLVLSNESDIQLYIGTGTGAFLPPSTFTVSYYPKEMTSGDFNGDGNPDLAVSTQSDNLAILLGNGAGSFSPVIDISTFPRNNMLVESFDYNNDGILDLAVSLTSTFTPNVYVAPLLGIGNGSFVMQQQYLNLVTTITDIAAADFNLDGNADLLTSVAGFNNSPLLKNTGTGSLVVLQTFPTPLNPRAIAIGDFNLDGMVDVAVANDYASPTHMISVYLNNISVPSLSVTASSSLSCVGEPVDLFVSGANSYTWSTGENSASITVIPNSATSYSVLGANSNGCKSSASVVHAVDACAGLFDINESKLQLTVFPNPAANELSFSSNNGSFNNLCIVNALGQVVQKDEFQSTNKYVLDVTEFANGLYFIKIENENNQRLMQQFLVQH